MANVYKQRIYQNRCGPEYQKEETSMYRDAMSRVKPLNVLNQVRVFMIKSFYKRLCIS